MCDLLGLGVRGLPPPAGDVVTGGGLPLPGVMPVALKMF